MNVTIWGKKTSYKNILPSFSTCMRNARCHDAGETVLKDFISLLVEQACNTDTGIV